jgi:hypothetical protein
MSACAEFWFNPCPDLAMPICPGHLVTADGKSDLNVPVPSAMPPTFLVQAVGDFVDGMPRALVHYPARAKAHAPMNIHLSNSRHTAGRWPSGRR